MRFRGEWAGCGRPVAGLGIGLLVGVALAVFVGSGTARAADRNGVVVAVQPKDQSFQVAGGGGPGAAVVTFRTDAKTRVTFGRKVVPFGNLVPGDRVSVRYREHDLGPVATAVEIHHLKPGR